MIINHNLGSMNAQRNMGINSTNASKSMEKLSSGLRINRAGDDAAGLAISEKMRGQIRGLDQASSNAQNAISLIGTGEGALNETHSILQRMRELAVQSSSDTNVGTDREQIQSEVNELAKEISRISNDTEFNQKNLLGGNLNDTYQVGANKDQNINLKITAMDAQSLGVASDALVTTGTVLGKVSAATFTGTLGTGIEEAAQISAIYTDATVSTAAAATLTGADVSAQFSVDQSGLTSITLNGQAVALTDTKALDGSVTPFVMDDLVTALQADIDAVYDGVANAGEIFTVGQDATSKMLTITSSVVGATSSVDITANADSATLKLTVDGTTDATAVGSLSGIDASAKVTLTSTGTGAPTQSIDVAGTETSLNVTSGVFQGMNLTFTGAASTLETSGTANNVTVALTATDSTFATFAADGTMTKATVQAGIDVSTQTVANDAIETINDAIETVSIERAKLGAYTNRLEHTIANLGTSSENLTSAESRIRDVDMAKEMSTFSKNNILAQAAQAMLAQANQQPQQVLQLLR